MTARPHLFSISGESALRSARSNEKSRALASPTVSSPVNPMKAKIPAEDLFEFAKIPLGDFEHCLAFIEAHKGMDFRASADDLLWQTYKAFERLIKRDFEDKFHPVVQDFANQCVQQYALLDYGADCGYENTTKYLHELVLTSDWYRQDYLTRMMALPPPSRLEFVQRPVQGHMEPLRLFCILFDHLYEKIEAEARHRLEKTFFDKIQSRVMSRINAQGPDMDIGRAL